MKKIAALLPCVWSECRSVRFFLPFYVIVLSIVCTLLLSILSFAETIPQRLRRELDSQLEALQYTATVLSATKEQAEALAEIECEEIRISYLAEPMLLNNAVLGMPENSDAAMQGTILIYAGKHSAAMQITDGRAPDFSDNSAEMPCLWLSQTAAAASGGRIGSEIRLTTARYGSRMLTVAGIYADDSTEYDYVVSAAFADDLIAENGLSKRQSCTMLFRDYSSCQRAEAQLTALGCTMQASAYETVDAYYDSPRAMQAIFLVIAFVLFCCLGILLYSMNSMLIDMRSRFIGLSTCLGASVRSIIVLYAVLCEPLLLLSMLLGALGSRIYIDRTVLLMKEYLDVEMQASELYTGIRTLLLGWLGANVILLLVFLFLRKKICSIASIALLAQSEGGR